jgi:hypothetical protein
LDTNIPELLKPKEQKTDKPKLTFWAACYFAQAIKHREFLIQKRDISSDAKLIFLWMLARDTAFEMESKGLTSYPELSYKAGEAGPLEQIEFYSKLEFGVAHELSEFIERYLIAKCSYEAFEHYNMWLVNKAGAAKLKTEWPDIWQRFDLENQTTINN